jgi:hypothetical protein
VLIRFIKKVIGVAENLHGMVQVQRLLITFIEMSIQKLAIRRSSSSSSLVFGVSQDEVDHLIVRGRFPMVQ